MQVIQFIVDNKAIVLGFLFALSELLSLIPGVKANGVFDFIFKALQSAKAQQ